MKDLSVNPQGLFHTSFWVRFSERCWEVFFLSGYHLEYNIKRASDSFQHINQLRQIKFAEFCCSQKCVSTSNWVRCFQSGKIRLPDGLLCLAEATVHDHLKQ